MDSSKVPTAAAVKAFHSQEETETYIEAKEFLARQAQPVGDFEVLQTPVR